ncbi:MAG: hypothetical protein CM1200mP25_4330 [Acidobacteriota bacterium]|nr:MAG: hypothetical protein CM1200mP25_4330 [Acidobacteriota bacterium]
MRNYAGRDRLGVGSAETGRRLNDYWGANNGSA